MTLHRLNQSGDTIVEVIIAVVVIGAIMVGAYAAIIRGTNFNQSTQERAQATKLVQAQIERLRDAGSIDTGQYSCFKQDGKPVAATPGSDPCRVTGSGGTPGDGQLAFTLAITPSVRAGTYAVTATWDALTNSGQNRVQMYYSTGERS